MPARQAALEGVHAPGWQAHTCGLGTSSSSSHVCAFGLPPPQLVDNRNCVLCMECLKACPHR